MADRILTDKRSVTGPRHLLSIRDFRLLWLNNTTSRFGDNLTELALLLLVTRLTGSTTAIATMAIAIALPQVLFGMLSGVFADRLPPKRTVVWSTFLRSIVVLAFCAIRSPEHVWWLYAIGFLQAAIGTLDDPSRAKLFREILTDDDLLAGSAFTQSSQQIAGVLGTTAAGGIIGALDAYWPAFAMDALTFFLGAALVHMMFIEHVAPATDTEGAPSSILQELRAGIGAIVRSPVLIAVVLTAAVATLGLGALTILVIPFLLETLHVTPAWFGATEGAQTAAMVLSGSLVALLSSRLGPRVLVIGGLFGLGIVAIGLATSATIWQALIAFAAAGLFLTPLNAAVSTIAKTAISRAMLGRVVAAINTVSTVANLLAMAAAGILADILGVRAVFLMAAGIIIAAAVIAIPLLYQATSEATPRKERA